MTKFSLCFATVLHGLQDSVLHVQDSVLQVQS